MIFFIEEINNATIMKLYHDYDYYCIYGCVQDNLKFVNICISFTCVAVMLTLSYEW